MGFLLEGPSMDLQSDSLKKNQNAFKWIIFPMRNIFFAKKTSDRAKSKKQLQRSTQGTHVTWLINVRFLYIGKRTLNNQLAVEFCRPAEALKLLKKKIYIYIVIVLANIS